MYTIYTGVIFIVSWHGQLCGIRGEGACEPDSCLTLWVLVQISKVKVNCRRMTGVLFIVPSLSSLSVQGGLLRRADGCGNGEPTCSLAGESAIGVMYWALVTAMKKKHIYI